MGTLYIVGTPIGNLGDFSPRAIEILKTVDFIAAEDTRVTLKLLNHFEIRNTLISYHEHNAAARGPELLERLLNGENGAIVTDAGMPCISDPGEGLVALCHENEVEIATVPGPTAAMKASRAISGSMIPVLSILFSLYRSFCLGRYSSRASYVLTTAPGQQPSRKSTSPKRRSCLSRKS